MKNKNLQVSVKESHTWYYANKMINTSKLAQF